MVTKNHTETIEFFDPKLGLDVEPYIAANQKQGIHHIARYQWATRVLQGSTPGRLVDVACGGGYGSYILAQALPEHQIIGGDYDERAVELARQNYSAPNLEYRQLDIVTWTDLQTEDSIGTVEYVVSFDTIEHLHHREIALIHLTENLDFEGMLMLSTPCGRTKSTLNPGWEHHKIEYGSAYLYNLMRRCFRDVMIPDDGSLPHLDYWTDVINKDVTRYLLKVNPIVCQRPMALGLTVPRSLRR